MLVIDEKATKKAIENMLFKYREYLVTLPSSMLPKVTASYSLVPPQNTNTFNSQTENVAIERVMYEQERTKYMDMIHKAVDELQETERTIIIESYLIEDTRYDIAISADLYIGKTKYYLMKKKALLKLASFLNVEVYKR